MLTRDEIARLALKTLDAQKRFFALPQGSPERRQALIAAKDPERDLRHDCERILGGNSLFKEGD